MHVDERALENFILELGLVSRRDWQETLRARKESGGDLKTTLLKKGILGEDDIRRAEAHILGIPFVDLKTRRFDLETLSIIPEPLARAHSVVAFSRHPELVEVALLDLSDLSAVEFLRREYGLKVMPRFTDKESIKHAIISYQKILKSEFGDIIRKESSLLDAEYPLEEWQGKNLIKLAEHESVSLIFNSILNHALVQHASDIHLEPNEHGLLVRYRIAGKLHEAMVLPKRIAYALSLRAKYLCHLDLMQSKVLQEGRFEIFSERERISVKTSVMPVYGGEKVVMKVLRSGSEGLFLENFGFEAPAVEAIHEALSQNSGLIIASARDKEKRAGLISALIDILNTPKVSISTVEDEIVYRMKRVNQTQIRPEISFGYPQGIRAVMKQDPDIIAVGEISDAETLDLCEKAALSGKLIIAGVEAGSASEAVSHLQGMGLNQGTLASTLQLVVSQKIMGGVEAYYEAMKITPTIKELVAAGAGQGEIEEEAKREHML